MDQAKVLNFKKALSDANNILIVLPKYINTDTISSATSIYNFISHTLKKNVTIASDSDIPERFSHIISTSGIDESNVLREIKPLQYIVRVQSNEKDLNIVFDRRNDEVDIIMTPKTSVIDLSKVTLTTYGHNFDMFIFINTEELSDAGFIYTNLLEAVKRQKPYIITSNNSQVNDAQVLGSSENTTASESVYQILEMFGVNLNQAIKDILFEGIVSGTDGLHKVNSSSAIETVLKIASHKDLSDKLSNLFYGYSAEGLELRKKIFSNLKTQDNIIYSELTDEDLLSLNIKGTQLDGIDYLPFSIVDDQNKYYVLGFGYGDQKKILIQNKDLKELYKKLKDLGYEVSRSNNIISIVTKNELIQVLKLLNDNIKVEDKDEEGNSQQYEINAEQESSEQPLFENTSNTKENNIEVNKQEDKKESTSSDEDLPFKPATNNTSKSTPFEQAKR